MAIQKTKPSISKIISDGLQVHYKPLGILFSIVLGFLVVSFAYKVWVTRRERAVQYDFSSLMTEYETMSQEKDPQWSVLLDKFEKNYEKHSNSSQLPYYMHYKVRILLNQGKKDEALAILNKVIDQMPGSPLIALYKMERALIQLDSADEATEQTGLEILKSLAYDANNDYRDSAQFYLGRYFWAINDVTAARQVWQQLVDEQHDEKMAPSPWVDYVQDKLNITIV